MKVTKFIFSMTFCFLILFIGFINLTNFQNAYRNAKSESPTNTQLALSKVESKYADSFKAKQNYIDLNGAVARLLGKRTLNGVVKLDNGQLVTGMGEVDTALQAQNMEDFRDYLAKINIPFLYIQAPYALADDENAEFKNLGKEDYANENADNFLEDLQQRNINTLDIREKIKEEGLDPYSLFFKTDHHWNVWGGFFAYQKTVEKISEILKIEIQDAPSLEISQYGVETRKNIFLGTSGERTGKYFAGVEDFEMLLPKFETALTLEESNGKIIAEGSYEEALLAKERLDNWYKSDMYYTFLRQAYKYAKISNDLPSETKKVFLIKDSFNQIMASFLSLYYEEVHVFDLRSGTPEELFEKINEIEPDIVLCMYYPGCLNNLKMFNFLPDPVETN